MTVEDEHEELVAELARLEKLSAEERLKAAKKRRLSQLERWKKVKQTEDLFPPIQKANKGRPVKFEDSTTLIEASARNDAEEGMYSCAFLTRPHGTCTNYSFLKNFAGYSLSFRRLAATECYS